MFDEKPAAAPSNLATDEAEASKAEELTLAVEKRRQVALATMKEFQNNYPGVAHLFGDEKRGFFMIIKKPQTMPEQIDGYLPDQKIDVTAQVHPMLTEAGWRILKFIESAAVSYEQSEEHFQQILESLAEETGRILDKSVYLIDGEAETLLISSTPSAVSVKGTNIEVSLGGKNPFVKLEKVGEVPTFQAMLDKAKEQAGFFPKAEAKMAPVQDDLAKLADIKI